eukprot:TRINITY_DN2871_c0_g1_i1.p1 TRINITY_DN2871_c0_g1~~TRINITY_DN2871_c0_g1_i1.p1  ORF type:complete len:1552 (+),score=670.31 TRINITY_DN2871_c0_g1_i1:90-4745(+)
MATTRPRVYCRIRPLGGRELAAEPPRECFFDSQEPDALLYRTAKSETVRSRFDEVFGTKASQTDVHGRLRGEVLASLFSGYNATVFAYGQTGSGKTHTMEGPTCVKGNSPEYDRDKGLVPRLIDDIFERFQDPSYENCSVQLSYVQVYQDKVQDLLQGRQQLDIRLDKSGHYVASGATWQLVRTMPEAMAVYQEAGRNRATNATEMNLVSSRSHALLQLQLQWDEPLAPGSNAKLNLVDLAGSEKVSFSGATGEKLKEAIAINKSLSSLSNVVKALVEQAKDPMKRHHVPYKDSKLTYLLQSSLGGSNLVHFILCISASSLWRSESNNTIEFGKRALRVVLKPVKNAIDYKRLEEMERMIEQMRKHISELEGKLADKDREPKAAQIPGQPAAGFLQMDAIRQEGAEEGAQEPDAFASQKEGVRKQLAELAAQQRTVEGRLATRESELSALRGATAREQQLLQKRLEEERARHAQELSTLQSNVDAQHSLLRQMEADAQKASAEQTKRSEGRQLSRAQKSKSMLQKKTNMELERIYKNLPESLHELTSHCILFPQSKARFRELGGVKKLLGYVDSKGHKGLESYKAHAAYALSIVLEENGRDDMREQGGLEALAEVLQRPDEHSKQFACRALESAVRGCAENKRRVGASGLLPQLVALVGRHPNQQVQEAACSALAEVADGQSEIKARLREDGLLAKMVALVRDTPPEVADLIKIGVSVIGRLAQQDLECQREIARLDGVAVLTKILFSPVGEKDPQLPVLTAYALVNLCCSNKQNMAQLQKHPQYPEIRFKLLEGLGRVFVDNIVSENRERATASHEIRDGSALVFSYHGVTSQGEWGTFTAGGRPTYSTFLENPQFALTVSEDCSVSIVISDVDYETRLRSRTSVKTKTIYMGIAVFKGDAELCSRGLKQIDFNGRFVTSGRYNRNRENTLSLTLKQSADPYVIVPFTAHSLQYTRFALSVFADGPVELTRLPEESGWMKTVYEGEWTEMTGRGVDAFDWRNADQYTITVQEPTEIVAVLSYRSLDDFRQQQALAADEDELGEDDPRNEERRERPHLHGRVFESAFAQGRRFVRSNIPSPQNSAFVACNEYLSTSCVKTTAKLQPGKQYVYVPSTETPFVGNYRVAFYCDKDDVSISPLRPQQEWYTFHFCDTWKGGTAGPSQSPALLITGTGDITLFGVSRDVYLRLTLYEIVDGEWTQGSAVTPQLRTQKVCSTDAFWAQECVLETALPPTEKAAARPRAFLASLEGITTNDAGEQRVAQSGDFTFALYAADIGVSCVADLGGPGDLRLVNRLNAGPDTVSYGRERAAFADPRQSADDEAAGMAFSDTDSEHEGDSRLREELAETKRALEHARAGSGAGAGPQSAEQEEIARLRGLLDEKQQMIDSLSATPSTPLTPHQPQPPTDNAREPLARQGSAQPPRRTGSAGLSRRNSTSSAGSAAKAKPAPKRGAAGTGAAGAKGIKNGPAAAAAAAADDSRAAEVRRLEAELAAARAASERQAAAQRGLAKRLAALSARPEAPGAEEWRRLRTDFAELAAQMQGGSRSAAP